MGRGDYDDSDSDNEPINHSDDFKDSHSGCTDLPCFCVWIVCLVGFVWVMIYGFQNGNPRRLHHGIDDLGRVCGVDAGVELLPYTYFCPPSSWGPLGGALTQAGLSLTNPVCVAACPVSTTATDAVAPAIIPQCSNTSTSTTAYKTVQQLNYCMPDSGIHAAAAGSVAEGISGAVPSVMKAADSIGKGWPIYIMTFFLAVLLGYVYICCLKAFAKCMVWLAIIVAFFALLGMGIWLITEAKTVGTNAIMSQFGQFATGMSYCIGGLCCAGAILIASMAVCCFGQIDDAIIAVKMTTDVMVCIPSLLFAPVVKAIIKFITACILLAGFVYLLSCAQPKPVLGSALMRQFEFKDDEKWMIFFYAFMSFWIMSFLTALYQFTVAYVTADYYFATCEDDGGEDRDIGCCTLVEGLCCGLMHHQGSFAFGSFIIAIFSMVQRAIEYIDRSNPNNPVVHVLMCVCWCCITGCKSFAEFVNKNAYIGIAIKSYNFCQAAKKALQVMASKAVGMAVLNGATLVFQIAGLLLITSLCMLFADAVAQVGAFADPTSKWYLPQPPVVVLVSGLIGFALAKVFMDVFDMVSDTLMYCFGLEGFNSGSNKAPPAVKQAFADAKDLQDYH